MHCRTPVIPVVILLLICSLMSAPVASASVSSTSDVEALIAEGWDGGNVIDLTEQLSEISAEHITYRMSGTEGANEAADFIMDKFAEYGLQVHEESYEMPVWTLTSQPSLFSDMDGNVTSDEDRQWFDSFMCEGFSTPTVADGLWGELVTLPLPQASSYADIGTRAIDNRAWAEINITGKVLFMGREVRWSPGWENTFKDKLLAQPPAAIIFHYHYSWMSFAQNTYQLSSGGLPLGDMGTIYQDQGIVVGSVNYSDGQSLGLQASIGRQVNVKVPAVLTEGMHKNIVADIPSSVGSTEIVLLGAHYDTVLCEGYVDNSAGVATILETARTVQAAIDAEELTLKYGIRFVAFAGEEMGLAGSIHYVDMHEDEMNDHVAMIVTDSLGSSNLKFTMAGSEGEIDLNYIADRAAEKMAVPCSYQDMDGSDHLSFMFPMFVAGDLNNAWGTDLYITRASKTTNTMLVYSEPLTNYDSPTGPVQGRIHTALDSREAVGAGEWIDDQDLQDQAQVFALMTLYAGIAIHEPNYDYLPYVIFLLIVVAVIAIFMFRQWSIE